MILFPKPKTDRRRGLSKAEFEQLAHIRYRLRRFLRFSEDLTRKHGITMLQYLLMLQIKGFPGREWATVGELAERLQAKHHGVVSLVSRCEAAGLVKRGSSGSDRRRVEVTLTREGAKCLDRLARLHWGELASLQAEFAVPTLTRRDPDLPVRKSDLDESSPKRATRAKRSRAHGDRAGVKLTD